MPMEENQRSGQPSGLLVKKPSSSGCLIVRKKGDVVAGASSSGSRKVYAAKKEKKRPRLVVSESESSEEDLPLPPPRRAVGAETVRVCNGWNQEQSRKRSRLDVFDFDEYDGFDERPLGRRLFDDGRRFNGSPIGGNGSSEKSMKRSDEAIRVQGRNGVLKVHVKKTKESGPSKQWRSEERRKVSRSEEIVKRKANLQKSMPTKISKSFDENSEDSDTLLKHTFKNRRTSKTGDISKRNAVPPPQEERKRYERPNSVRMKDKNKLNFEKSVSIKVNDSSDGDSESEDSDSKNVRKRGSVSKGNEKTPQSKVPAPVKSMKRGSGTEKQKLRENIRNMLLEAGWTIDYRPRRNRDYLDAVYINPSGTAYWSIIKAYDALQKQIQEDNDEEKAFKISDDILSQLTRKTQKKIQREMKNRQKDASGYENTRGSSRRKASRVKDEADSMDSDSQEDKLSSFMKSSKVKKTTGSLSTNLRKKSANSVKMRKQGRCTLLVRRSDEGSNPENDGFVLYTGKRTILSWLIDSGVVELSQKVQYMNRRATRVLLEGWITRDGIHCGCCSKILTVSKFEIHAGSKLRQPFQYICLESGVSLLQCQIDAWNRQEESDRSGFHSVDVDGDDPNDDTCGICGDGGDLICCDGCPSTFHQSCLSIEILPMGDWHCPNCTCKFCGLAGVPDDKQDHGATSSDRLRCSLCERKFHKSCIKDMDSPSGDSTVARPFCSQQCTELFEHLQKDLGVKHELEAGYSWSIIRRMDPNSDTSSLGHPQRVECNSKLAVALSIMDECFLPIVDRRTGINMIHNVLYNCGSNFNRIDYGGFYTVVLEKGDEIISAASLRFHGTQLAEMPFIGTRHIYRRQGMCRRLFSAIESDLLLSLKVEKLIIPAIAELIQTWTSIFGFTSLEESLKHELSSLNILVFPGLDMLHKLLHKQETATSERTAASTDLGLESMEIKEGQKLEATSPGSDEPTSDIPSRNAEADGAESDPIGRGSSSDGGGTCPTRSSSLDNTADKFTESEVDQNGHTPIANGGVDGVSETNNGDGLSETNNDDGVSETNNGVDLPEKELLDGSHEIDDDADPVAVEVEEKARHDSKQDDEGAKNATDEEMDEKVKDASPYSEIIKKDEPVPNDSAVGVELMSVDDEQDDTDGAKNATEEEEEMDEKVKDVPLYSESIKKDDQVPTVGNGLHIHDECL